MIEGRSFWNDFSPIPLTLSKSSTRLNGPCCSRNSMMRFAMTSPIPGSPISSSTLARLMSTGSPGLPESCWVAAAISTGAAASLGVLPANQGRIVLDGDLRNGTAIALSVEPESGSSAPTSAPILLTSLE